MRTPVNYKDFYSLVKEQLKHESNDIELWISLAIAIVAVPIVDYEKSIACLQKALDIDNNNPVALIVLAHVYEYELGGIDNILLHQIKTLYTDSDEINSMLKYVASWSYRRHKKNDPKMEEKLLKQSIQLCDKYVWNYVHLAELYMQEERYLEINEAIKKALSNIKKIYTDENIDEYKTTSINDFINSRIKGTHITDSNVKFIKQDIIPKHVILFYSVMTPILKIFHFIKANW